MSTTYYTAEELRLLNSGRPLPRDRSKPHTAFGESSHYPDFTHVQVKGPYHPSSAHPGNGYFVPHTPKWETQEISFENVPVATRCVRQEAQVHVQAPVSIGCYGDNRPSMDNTFSYVPTKEVKCTYKWLILVLVIVTLLGGLAWFTAQSDAFGKRNNGSPVTNGTILPAEKIVTGEGSLHDVFQQAINLFRVQIREDTQNVTLPDECEKLTSDVEWLNSFTGAMGASDFAEMHPSAPCATRESVLYRRHADGVMMEDGEIHSDYSAKLSAIHSPAAEEARMSFEHCAQNIRVTYETKCSERAKSRSEKIKKEYLKASFKDLIKENPDLTKTAEVIFCASVLASEMNWDVCPRVNNATLQEYTRIRLQEAKMYGSERISPIPNIRLTLCQDIMRQQYPTAWTKFETYHIKKTSGNWYKISTAVKKILSRDVDIPCVYV